MTTAKDGMTLQADRKALMSLILPISVQRPQTISIISVQGRQHILTDSATSLASQMDAEPPDTATTQPVQKPMALSATVG